MRIVLLVVGCALVVAGVVWVFQGIGTLRGSFMTGRTFWAWVGAGAVLVGAPMVARGLRRPR